MDQTKGSPPPTRQPTQADYEALAEFRYALRCFLEFSEKAAREVGLTPQQHQALLAIRGFPGRAPVSIGDLADRLRIRHHSAVELVDRLSAAGLIARVVNPADQRRVFVVLTDRAEALLAALSAAHLDELDRIGPSLAGILNPHRLSTAEEN